MRSSDKGNKRGRSRNCLVVDGYNMLARMKERALHQVEDIEAARQELTDWLMEYAAFSGDDVLLVFDAHRTTEPKREHTRGRVQIMYTAANETADERIERLTHELRDVYRRVTVVTSDAAEQQVAFGSGALRMPTREFFIQLQNMKRTIHSQVSDQPMTQNPRLGDAIRQDLANILEKWRRQ